MATEEKLPDELQDQPEDPLSIAKDENRMNTIMKIDTSALLSTINQLERQLSDYQKQNELPHWAQGMSAKIDFLEKVHNKTPRGENTQSASPFIAGAEGSSLEKHAEHDMILDKVRQEMGMTLDRHSGDFDSKVNSLSWELDRMHKLLQIRPTTSELQQVVLSVHEISQKMDSGVTDVKKNVRGLVHDKVAEEMGTIISNIQSNSDLNAQSIALIAKKVDSYNGDITNIRKAAEQAADNMNKSVKQCMVDTQASKELVLQLQERADEDAAKAEQGIKEVAFALSMTNEKVEETKKGLKEQVSDLNQVITDQDDMVKALMAENTAKMAESSRLTSQTAKEISDFRLAYEVDATASREATQTVTDKLQEIDTRFTEISEYVIGLKDADVMNLIELQNDQITGVKTSIEDVEATVSSVSTKMNKVNKIVAKCEEEMEKLPASVNAANDRVNDLTLETEKMREQLSKQEMQVREQRERIEELEKLVEEVSLLKVTAKDIDGRLKQAQSTAMSLLEATGDHDKRLEGMTELIDNSDAMVEQKMLKMQGEIMDNVAAKQAAVEALVANMHENIEVMGLGLDGGSQSSQEPAKGARGGGSRPGSRNTAKANAPGVPAAVAGVPTDAGQVVMSQAEKNEVIGGSAEFIADLCCNFEEISVRKTYVADLPSAMCEDITATSQSLTAFIAGITDSEAVQTVLRGNAGEVEYDANVVAEMRSRKVEEFMQEVLQIVQASNNSPGTVRVEARTKFMRQIRRAIDLCMSKHDQVLIVGNSRGSRIKIPTCIACDRPLLDKVRQEQMIGPDSGVHKDFPAFGEGGRIIDTNEESQPEGFDGVAGSPPPRTKQRSGKNRLNSTPSKVGRPNSSHGGADASTLRASLKIPRPGMSGNAGFGKADSRAEAMFPELARSQSDMM